MEINGKDTYFIAVKIFLRDGDKLLITHDVFGDWDLPGGRLKSDEFDADFADIVNRKMKEELGGDLEFSLGDPRIFFRHERNEHDMDLKVRIFAIGYEAQYRNGKITLGKHHDKLEWVDVAAFSPENYFTGGWLKGVKEYKAMEAK